MMKTITSRDNPGYKALKTLAEDHRQQRRQGVALLDGVHLVEACCDKLGPAAILRLIVSEQGAGQPEVQRLCSRLQSVETWLLRDNLFRALSEVVSPVGILALIRQPETSSSNLAPGASCVLLDAVQDAGNVGSILRTAAAAGFHDVFLGPGCAGAWTPRVLRAAQGAHFSLCLREQADLAAVMADFSGLTLAATAHGKQSIPLYHIDLHGPLAWLFGSEGQGISPHLEAAARIRAVIPLATGCESLNVAAAAAICLFESNRQRLAE
jgi:TrmH family RNA methyltransferase